MELSNSVDTREAEKQSDALDRRKSNNRDKTCHASLFRPATERLGPSSTNSKKKRLSQIRTLKRRSSVENFGHFGLLTPALVLQPLASRGDSLTQQFQDLQAEHKELKLAAAHIEDALTGRGKYGKARSFFKSRRAQRCFNVLSNPWFQKLVFLNILLHSLVITWEPPNYEPTSLHPSVVVVNVVCLLVYVVDLVVHITFLNWSVFWSNMGDEKYWNGARFILVCCFAFDFIILISSWVSGEYFPQVFRCFRLSMLLCKSKNIRHIFDVLKTIGIRLVKLFLVYLVFIFFFACIAIHLFMEEYECDGDPGNENSTTMHHGERTECFITQKEIIYKGAFNNVIEAMIRLFVLLSTENYPEIMLPSLRVHYLYFSFFGIFIFVGVFFLTAILLAIIVDSYWEYSKKSVKEERARERAELAKAWNLLDPLGHGALSVNDEKFTELFRILKPKNRDEENQILIGMLDSNDDNEIDSFEWTTTLSQVLNYEFEEEDFHTANDVDFSMKRLRSFRGICRRITQSVIFTYAILGLLGLHCCLFSLHWKDRSSTTVISIQGLKTVIVSVFMFEVAVRCIALGSQILKPIELMDTILVVIGFLFNLLWYFKYPGTFWFRQYAGLISGVAIFGRLLFNSAHFLKAVQVVVVIAPVMLDLILLLTILIYFLSTVGMELLYDKTTKSEEYPGCGLGFQTFWCSCLTLFQVLSTSNWHEIMNKVVESTGNKWYTMFFIVSYTAMTLIVMNVFVAIAIEAFNKLVSQDDQELRRQSSVTKNENKTSMMLQMIGSVAGKIFRSPRTESVGPRRQSLTPATKTSRSGSIANPFSINHLSRLSEYKRNGKDLSHKEVNDGAVEDWGNLSINQKREMILKNRMKKRKKARLSSSDAPLSLKTEHIVRVVTAFRALRKGDLDLTVGDEVVVTKENDDWWEGRCKNNTGRFPASHVIAKTSKAIPEYHNKSETSQECIQVFNPNINHLSSQGSSTSGKDDPVFVDKNENCNIASTNRSRSLSRGSYDNPNSRVNALRPHSPAVKSPKMRMKKTRNWRKDILGDMTIMNADEMRELNNIMRAELRTPVSFSREESSKREKRTSVTSVTSQEALSRDNTFLEQGFPKEDKPVMPRSYSKISLTVAEASQNSQNATQPMFLVSSVESTTRPPTPPRTANSRNESSYLKVKSEKGPQNNVSSKPQGKSGDMPEWMVRFVSRNNLVIGQDMKFPESDIPSEPSETELPHVVADNTNSDHHHQTQLANRKQEDYVCNDLKLPGSIPETKVAAEKGVQRISLEKKSTGTPSTET